MRRLAPALGRDHDQERLRQRAHGVRPRSARSRAAARRGSPGAASRAGSRAALPRARSTAAACASSSTRALLLDPVGVREGERERLLLAVGRPPPARRRGRGEERAEQRERGAPRTQIPSRRRARRPSRRSRGLKFRYSSFSTTFGCGLKLMPPAYTQKAWSRFAVEAARARRTGCPRTRRGRTARAERSSLRRGRADVVGDLDVAAEHLVGDPALEVRIGRSTSFSSRASERLEKAKRRAPGRARSATARALQDPESCVRQLAAGHF